jgi:aminoglycoside phosphotransferase (APT) family kinase protein
VLLEIHCHTAEHSSCSRIPAADVIRQAIARKLQGAVFTDHHYRWDDAELAALRRDAGVPEHFLLLSGQEVSTSDLGHVLVFGRVPSLAAGTPAAEIRARYPDAALVRAHPYRHKLVHELAALRPPIIDAVEIFSANHTLKANSRALEDWHRHRFTAVAGTDAHGQTPAGTYPTQFDHPVGDVDELAAEIRHGRCRPLLKELTHGGANSVVTEVVIGTKGDDAQRPRILLRRISRAEDWPAALHVATLTDRIAGHGFDAGRYRVPALLATDAARLTIIEEGVRGRPLFERLRAAGAAEGRLSLQLAAGWLAHLHNQRLAVTPPGALLGMEAKRIERYAARFAAAGLPSAPLVRALATAMQREERRIVDARPEALTQCHGDYHPKNLIVGQDNPEDAGTVFIAAVDLEDAVVAPPAFDVGWFVAHYRHQFAGEPHVLAALPPELFVADYRAAAVGLAPGFDDEVAFFDARAGLSIAGFLVKVGLGDSPDVARLLDDAARLLLPRGA